ncbi:hypothetical protein GKJPGBOP_04064 [Streptomyces paromomycinus]|uniref:Uncharacterized protein n=1 Tax=Streptomyces paromomycinus TaxID=92743 RepID=A0A401W4X0_STREY|nr:hypothetical protein GKJPGBOP_04064 [Streptomyces paromomycinus]
MGRGKGGRGGRTGPNPEPSPIPSRVIRYATPALGATVLYVAVLSGTVLSATALRVPASDVLALGVAALRMTALSVIGLGMADLRMAVVVVMAVVVGMADMADMAVLSMPPRCAAFLYPAFLPPAFRRSPYPRATFRGLCRVLALMLAPAVRRSLMISRLVFGGLLRRSEPSPIATAAARRAVIGCRGGRSVHGLPRLERLSIVFALPQFGMCPQFPRSASEYLIDQGCPGNTLHSGHTSRSSGTACGLLLRSVPPGPAHRTITWKSGRGGPLCH